MNNFNQIFGLEEEKPLVPIQTPPPKKPKQNLKDEAIKKRLDEDLLDEYISSREDLDIIMQKGLTSLDEMVTIAKESQSPRFYEAITVLVKNLSEVNSEKLNLHEKMINIMKKKYEMYGVNPTQVTVNKVFIGNTKDLLQQVKPRETIIDV